MLHIILVCILKGNAMEGRKPFDTCKHFIYIVILFCDLSSYETVQDGAWYIH